MPMGRGSVSTNPVTIGPVPLPLVGAADFWVESVPVLVARSFAPSRLPTTSSPPATNRIGRNRRSHVMGRPPYQRSEVRDRPRALAGPPGAGLADVLLL